MNKGLIGFMFHHNEYDYEYYTPELSEKDEKAILSILMKYEETNAMFDPSIYGHLCIKDIDENITYDAFGNRL